MAQDQKDEKDPKAAAVAAVRDTTPAPAADAYPVEWLMEAEEAIGFPRSEIAGALSGVSRKTLTIEETRAAIEAWRTSPVKEA